MTRDAAVALVTKLVAMQWLPRSILHQCVCCSTHGRASSQLALWRCIQCQESALSWSAAETCKLSQELWTGTRAGARMPTIGSKPVPVAGRRHARERGLEREGVLHKPQGAPQALGCSGSAWGRSRSFRATPRDRYTSVTTVTAVSRVVSQKSNFQRVL